MENKQIAFRAEPELHERIEEEAFKVRYRTKSDWLREVVLAALPKRPKGKTPTKSANTNPRRQ